MKDWMTDAAKDISRKFHTQEEAGDVAIEEITDIIAAHVEPLMTLLRESKRTHTCLLRHGRTVPYECTCGADAWNARVEAVLTEE